MRGVVERNLQEITYPLRSDSLFFFYSDGLTEAMDTEQHQFGEEAIRQIIQAHRHDPAGKIQASVLESVKAFQGAAEQHDDITMIVAKYR